MHHLAALAHWVAGSRRTRRPAKLQPLAESGSRHDGDETAVGGTTTDLEKKRVRKRHLRGGR